MTLDDAPCRTGGRHSTSDPISVLSLQPLLQESQPATRHGKHGQHASCPRTHQTALLQLPRLLIWDHETTRRAQGKQEDFRRLLQFLMQALLRTCHLSSSSELRTFTESQSTLSRNQITESNFCLCTGSPENPTVCLRALSKRFVTWQSCGHDHFPGEPSG